MDKTTRELLNELRRSYEKEPSFHLDHCYELINAWREAGYPDLDEPERDTGRRVCGDCVHETELVDGPHCGPCTVADWRIDDHPYFMRRAD